MPNFVEHLAQAQRNEELYTELCGLASQYTEWEIVTLFYASLHYVDAWLARNEGIHPKSHKQRRDFVMRIDAFQPISEDYAFLYRLSIRARYEMEHLSIDAIRSIELNEFANIKRHIRELLRV